ncbi:MAG TPA: heparan-alpha-glucosaminide N-acetyltransferase domain-containing protein, partial [Thermoanaerobaculia bacterium]|nr:heparan-alpha-glucosaminide N-acetyltransferase domain-containing protein [Thermoanaerobaculia bacterium]
FQDLQFRVFLEALDVLRGAIIVVMALDHVRDYVTNIPFDPVDMSQTFPALFFTRWFTHFCAPGFSFFAGTAAFLSLSRGKTPESLARFLASRGLFLIALEFFVLRFVWLFNLWPVAFIATLWSLGVAMLVLAFLLKLRLGPRAIAGVGAVLVAGHNALDFVDKLPLTGLAGAAWKILHAGGMIPFGTPPAGFPLPGLFNLEVGYPAIPWPGVMALGYGFGALLGRPRDERRRLTFALGFALTTAFVVLRLANAYGDPRAWAPQKSAVMTFAAFLNCEKYPPSLCFLLMTLGPLLLTLAVLDRAPGPAGRFLAAYGRVPMFFYVAHLPIAHTLAVAVAAAQSGGLSGPLVHWAAFQSPAFIVPPPQGFGVGLPAVYALWIAVVLALYVPCVRYGDFKSRSRAAWTSYI